MARQSLASSAVVEPWGEGMGPVAGLPLLLRDLARSVDVGEYRSTLGLTQERFAEWLGVDVRTVQRWERQGAPLLVGMFLVALQGVGGSVQ